MFEFTGRIQKTKMINISEPRGVPRATNRTSPPFCTREHLSPSSTLEDTSSWFCTGGQLTPGSALEDTSPPSFVVLH
ncbi:hypothetical protein FKM82_015579 [Ascaphus truei]